MGENVIVGSCLRREVQMLRRVIVVLLVRGIVWSFVGLGIG